MANSKKRRNQNRSILAPESLEVRRVLTTVAGTVFDDLDNDAVLDASDPPISGVVVYLDTNDNGILDQRGFGLDPDEFAHGQVLNNARQTIFPSGTGTDNQPAFRVLAVDDVVRATTGQRIFGLEDTTDWGGDRRLRFDFTLPVDSVSLDTVGSSGVSSPNVRMDVYNRTGQLIDTVSINGLANAVPHKLEIARPQKDISYAIAHVTTVLGTVKFDNLRADDAGSERATVTSDTGFYRFANLPTGPTFVAQLAAPGYDQTSPATSYQFDLSGTRINLDFGNRTASIGGVVFEDLGTIGLYEPTVDRGIEGAGVYLDSNLNGTPDPNDVSIVPDVFLDNQVLDFVSSFITLSTVDENNENANENIVAATDEVASPNLKLFTHEGDPAWTEGVRLRADFDSLANRVQMRFTGGAGGGTERGKLVAYSATGEEIAAVETLPLALGTPEALFIQRGSYDISYVVAYTSEPVAGSDGNLRLSDLRAVMVKEPVAVTDVFGDYKFTPLASGDYQVRALPFNALDQSFPEGQVQQVGVTVGDTKDAIDFGFIPDNLPPVAKNDFMRTQEDFVVAVGVLENDSDPDGVLDEESVTITQAPLHGTAEVDDSGFINYTPNADFHGRDTLLYTVEDELGAVSNTAVVTIQVEAVNDPPVAVTDTVTVLGSNPAAFDVLGNDSDVDGELIASSVKITSNPTNGTAVVDPVTGVITYTPVLAGTSDELMYTVEDNEGAVSNEATVSITRVATGTPPVAVDDTEATLEGTATQVVVTSNDTDADGFVDLNSVFVVSLPTNGSVQVAGSGSVTYQPNLGFIGTDTFAYRVKDNDGLVSNSADVRISMTERDFPYQNPINNLDVDGDGNVSPRDVLFIIDEIDDRDVSSAETGVVTVNPISGTRPAGYFDVDGNGFIIGRDVLAVIQHINDVADAAGEPAVAEPNAAVASVFATQFDLFDDDDDEEERWLA